MKIMTIYGTRPEAIKVAPIIRAIGSDDILQNIIVTTGQHREMLDQVHATFRIDPDYDMSIMSHGQSLNGIISRVVQGVDEILDREDPDAVVVQGDTSSVVGAALASFNRGVPVVHLEAGLRSGDIKSPFPEEANRRITTQVASLHLAPTILSKSNLIAEGVDEGKIFVTGNSVIDALMYVAKDPAAKFDASEAERVFQKKIAGATDNVLLVTAHRRENLGPAMERIGTALATLARKYPRLSILFPIHRNPLVRTTIRSLIGGMPNVYLTDPLSYADFARALGLSDIILTDSGGVQEEAPSLGKPVLVMRENTERPEAVAAGTVRLVGTGRTRLIKEVSELIDSDAAYSRMANAVNPYGDGQTSVRAIESLKWLLDDGPPPTEFVG